VAQRIAGHGLNSNKGTKWACRSISLYEIIAWGMSRSDNMRAIRSKDMLPKLTVRLLVHRLGYRYRLHRKAL
jgi:hypothetical protein